QRAQKWAAGRLLALSAAIIICCLCRTSSDLGMRATSGMGSLPLLLAVVLGAIGAGLRRGLAGRLLAASLALAASYGAWGLVGPLLGVLGHLGEVVTHGE